MGRETLNESTDELQAKLVSYRLKNFDAVENASFKVPELNSPYAEMAETFGAAIIDHNDFRSRMIGILKQRSADSTTRLSDPAITIVLKALLALTHEQGRAKVYVGEVANTVNLLLKARDESFEFKARAMGDLLRKVEIFTEDLGSGGRGLKLMLATRRRIHELARIHQVSAALDGVDRCQLCIEARIAAAEASK